jgi:hypothetical protein
MSNGKGDRQRPVDKDVYDKNYEEIDWSNKKK